MKTSLKINIFNKVYAWETLKGLSFIIKNNIFKPSCNYTAVYVTFPDGIKYNSIYLSIVTIPDRKIYKGAFFRYNMNNNNKILPTQDNEQIISYMLYEEIRQSQEKEKNILKDVCEELGIEVEA